MSPKRGSHLPVEAFEQIETDVKLVMAGASSCCDEYSRELRMHAYDRIRIFGLDFWGSPRQIAHERHDSCFAVRSGGAFAGPARRYGCWAMRVDQRCSENRKVVDGAGFTFDRENAADLADRLRFLIANPTVREAAGRAARKRIEDHCEWQKITEQIERSYFEILGRQVAATPEQEPDRAAAIVGEGGAERRRAG